MKIGIYFKVENDILVETVSVEAGEPYGEAIQYGGHYEFWEKLRPRDLPERQFKAHAYDYYPRGRVVYFPKCNKYRLYSDRCLSAEDISMVVRMFELEGQPLEVAGDEHYRCARCNPHYMD